MNTMKIELMNSLISELKSEKRTISEENKNLTSMCSQKESAWLTLMSRTEELNAQIKRQPSATLFQ